MSRPAEWDSGTIDDVLEHVDVRNKDKSVDLVLSVTEGRGVIPQSEVFNKRVATDDTSKYKVLQPLDIAWNPYLLWTGAIGQWLGDRAGVTSPVYPVFRVRQGQDARFWGMFMEGGVLTPYFDSRAIGSIARRRRTTMPVFKEAPILIPPLPVQERIVEVIGAVDEQINALDSEADVLDELWWALGREMALNLAGAKRVPLASFCDIAGGLTKNKKDLEQPDLLEVPYLRVANVHRRRLNLSEVATIQTTRTKAEKLRLVPGDVLMNEGGDKDKLGRGHVWEGQIPGCIHQNHVFRVRVTDERFDPYFVSAWGNTFGQDWFETFGTQTTGIASITRATLSRFPVPDVPLSVQQDWAGRLGAVVETMDALRVQAASLRRVREGLLSGLLDRTISIESADLEV